jgi:hypothetical protein
MQALMNDALITLAAATFDKMLGEFSGAPFVELHDVMDPNQLLDDCVRGASAILGVTPMTGDAWLALVNAVADEYETRHAVAPLKQPVA